MKKLLLHKNLILLFLSLVFLFFVGYGSIVTPLIKNTINEYNNIADIEQQISTLKLQKEAQKAQIELEIKKQIENAKNLPLVIYTSSYPGMGIDAASYDLVAQVLKLVRDSRNSVTEISFDPGTASAVAASPAATPAAAMDPSQSMIAPSGPPFSTLILKLSLDSNFGSLQELLQKLYNWKYLIAIKDAVISPVDKENPNKLKVNLTLELYVGG